MGKRKSGADALSSEQLKAIAHYQEKYKSVVQMSIFPLVRFKVKDSGEIREIELHLLEHEYSIDKEEDSKAKKQEKKRLEQEAASKRRFA